MKAGAMVHRVSVVDSGQEHLPVGAEIRLQPNYSALVRAMTSPFVAKVVKIQSDRTPAPADHRLLGQ